MDHVERQNDSIACVVEVNGGGSDEKSFGEHQGYYQLGG